MADTNQILRLAAIIREVDGNHSKGAAALAESILDHPDFRAALAKADGPAVPEGREPASVTGQPSDQELLDIAASTIEPYECSGITTDEYEPETECAVEAYGSELIAFARAVLARWGNPAPVPPADGEVAKSVAWLRQEFMRNQQIGNRTGALQSLRAAELLERQAPQPPADGEVVEVVEWLHTVVAAYKSCRNTDHIWSLSGNGVNARLTVTLLTRAAKLLQRQVLVQVPDAERPWEREGWCDELGRCWWGRPDTGDWSADWTLATPEAIDEFWEFSQQTVCLPAHSLPLPEVGE